jgi:hypothetical protein
MTSQTTSHLPAHQARYLKEHSQCAICDTQLEIHHEINTKDLKLKEEAYCSQCGIRARSSLHLVH